MIHQKKEHVFLISSSFFLSLFFSLVVIHVLTGKSSKGKLKGRSKGISDPVTAEEDQLDNSVVNNSGGGGRNLSGSAPATPTEADTSINESTGSGSWSRNSLRGSKCKFSFSLQLSVTCTFFKKFEAKFTIFDHFLRH